MEADLFILCSVLSISLVMGFFSVTQRGYQQRDGGLGVFTMSLLSFIKGFILWPYFFPKGIVENKYKVNVFHKVGNRGR